MAIQTRPTSAPIFSMALAYAQDMVANATRGYANWRTSNATKKELYSLSERELADIGICYADIPRIAREKSVK